MERVKLFLPELKLANDELADRIKSEGVDSVQIDLSLSAGKPEGGREEEDEEDEEDEEEDEEGEGEEDVVLGGVKKQPNQKIIQLEFLLGDIPDDNPIALAEAEAEGEEAASAAAAAEAEDEE